MAARALRVKTRFTASDEITGVTRRIERNTARMNRGLQRGFQKSSREALQFKSVMKGILGASVIQKGIGALTQGVGEVARQFVGLDDAVTAATVRFKDIGPDAKDFKEQLDTIRTAAREAGKGTVFTATQAAQALDFLARAGFTSKEAMASLNTMINLSVATGSDFARAADISSDLLGAFGMAAKDTGTKIKNLTRLNDVLTYTANSANVDLENMFETMKDVGPIATETLKMSLEDIAGITAKFGDSGIKGTKAMTAIRGVILSLAAPASEGGKMLKALRVDAFDELGKPRKFVNVMQDLKKALEGMTDKNRTKALEMIFGKIPLAGASIFLRDIAEIENFTKAAERAGGTSKKTADIIGGSLGNQIKKLGSAFIDLGFNILGGEDKFKQFVKLATEGVGEISKAISGLKKTQEDIAKTNWREAYDKWEAEAIGSIKNVSSKALEIATARHAKGEVSEELKNAPLKSFFGRIFGNISEQVRQAQSAKAQQSGQTVDWNSQTQSAMDQYYSSAYQPKINVTTVVNAKNVETETKVESDKGTDVSTSGNVGENRF